MDFSPEPTNVIELRQQNMDMAIKKPSSNSFFETTHSIHGRFAYFPGDHVIIVYDMFLEVEKKIIPTTPNILCPMFAYVRLSDNIGFIVHNGWYDDISNNDQNIATYASLISIDFENGTYEVIDNKMLDFQQTYWSNISNPTPNTVMFVSSDIDDVPNPRNMLQIFKVNNSLSKIENHRSIDVESDEFYFHMIDGTIVYVKSYDYGKDIDATVYFEDHGHFVKIQNSDAFLEMRIPFDIASSERNIEGQDWWHETKFFYFRVIKDVYPEGSKSGVYIPFLWMFEMQTNQWSKINFNLPLECKNYRFSIDSDGFLNLIKYDRRIYIESSPSTVSLIRIALKAPDSLLNLCWFGVRKSGLSEKFPSLKLLTDPLF